MNVGSNGTWTYALDNADAQTNALAQGAAAADVFTYTVQDTNGATSSTTLTINITGTNDAPVAVADTNGVDVVTEAGVNPGNTAFPGDPSATGNVLTNDTDVDTIDTHTATPASLTGTYGSLSLLSNGTWTYTLNNGDTDTDKLNQGQVVTDTFNYTVNDNHGGSDTGSLVITITGTNDAPVITSDGGNDTASISIDENTTAVTTVIATDVDATHTLHYSLDVGNDASFFTIDKDSGVLSFQNAPDFENKADSDHDGVYVVGVVVTDDKGATDTQTISVTIKDVPSETVSGTGGADKLLADIGNDSLSGLAGTDTLIGGVGSDTLDGGVGNDKLDGGAGNDQLTGGADDDTFDFSLISGADKDTITDFEKSHDILHFLDVVDKDGSGGPADLNDLLLSTSVVDAGAGNDVTITMTDSGATIVLEGAGTGAATPTVADLVDTVGTQILIN